MHSINNVKFNFYSEVAHDIFGILEGSKGVSFTYSLEK